MLAFMFAAVLAQADLPTNTVQPKTSVPGPIWLRRPSADDLWRAYPEGARREVLEGEITLDCRINASGKLEDCRRVEDFGVEAERFTEAALSVSKLFRMATVDGEGRPVSITRIHVPMAFLMPPSATLAPVRVQTSAPKAVAIVDCRANPDAHLDNCTLLRLEPFSPEARARALGVAKGVRLGKGPPSPIRVQFSVEIGGG